MQQLKTLDRIAYIVTGVVLVAVVALRYIPPVSDEVFPFDIHLLPAFHALLNSMTAVSLIAALFFIKNKNIKLHQRSIYAAMGFSAIFLVSYIVYHFATEPTPFGGEGAVKTVYYILLASHIILAAVILPFIFLTFNRGFTNNVEKHKKMARWVFPLWLYVAITGVAVYFMIAPYY